MTPDELKTLMQKVGVTQKAALARLLDVHRATIYRWLDGTTPIDQANALLIRSKLKPPKK